MHTTPVVKTFAILGIAIALTVILMLGKPFLVPLAFGGVLSILLLPLVKWFHKKGLGQAIAIVLAMLTMLAAVALVAFLISWQVTDLAKNSSQIEQQVKQKYQQAQQYVAQKFGISPAEQQQKIKEQQAGAGGKAGSAVMSFLSTVSSMLTDLLLVLVYTFLFIYFRGRIRQFVLKLLPVADRPNGDETIHESQKVVQSYLSGLMLMIFSLWIMYGIGFTIVGVKYALFFAVLCGLLEIIPFIGNITGTAFTLAMSLVQGGSSDMVIGILVTYALVQFIQTYLLEPLIVGAQVSLNAMATIICLVAGELIWGIPGMVLAIPLMGMVKVICDHTPALQPFALLIGEDKKEDSGFKKKMKDFKKKIGQLFSKSK